VCGDGSVRGWKARSTSREEETPASKREKDRHIRSAWGVVKRAMRPQDPATGQLLQIAERSVGARSRSVVGRKLVARISGR